MNHLSKAIESINEKQSKIDEKLADLENGNKKNLTWTTADTSPATYTTYGGIWQGYPESNMKIGKMWHSKNDFDPRGVIVTFEYNVTITKFIGDY